MTAAVVGAAANHLGLSPADLAGQAARYAERAVADALMALDVDGFDRCGYLPAATAKLGTVLVTNEFRPYAPKVDLVGAGIEFAEALERDRYRADDLTFERTSKRRRGFPLARPRSSGAIDSSARTPN